MKRALLIATIVSSTLAAAAQRDAASADYWTQACLAPAGTQAESTCLGYLLDAVRTHAAVVQGGKVKPYYCIPAQVTDVQIKATVVKYLADNPQYRDADFGEVVTVALARQFPCAPR